MRSEIVGAGSPHPDFIGVGGPNPYKNSVAVACPDEAARWNWNNRDCLNMSPLEKASLV